MQLSDKMMMAVIILTLSYVLLFTEKLNRAVVAILGASLMIFAGVLTQESALAAVDFNTLALLIGMMTIVGIGEKSGMFQFVAIWSAQKVKARPRMLLMVLAVVTAGVLAVFSAFLDNVTTVLLMVPIIFQVTRKLKVSPYPFLIMEILASNIGGTATLIGDPPNILIGSALGLSFMDFVYALTPVVAITMVVLLLALDAIWGRKMESPDFLRNEVLQLEAAAVITDRALMWKSLTVLIAVIGGFIAAEHYHIANGTIAMFGAAVLLILYTAGSDNFEREHKIEQAFNLVDWTTIFFFAGLFALVFGLEEAGALTPLADWFINMAEGSIKRATMIMLWLSAFASTLLGNIPFVATMIPLIKNVENALGGRDVIMPVWWALSLGSCFGGNGSLIAASANVIVAGMANKEGVNISFVRFLLWALPTMVISVGIAAIYLHFRYF